MITRSTLVSSALVALLLVSLSACSTGSDKGPDLASQLNEMPALTRSTTPPEGVDVQGADGTWVSDGTPEEVKNLVSAQVRPDETNESADGDTFLLYRSGSLWITPTGNQTAVVLYRDNETAYRRHSGVLLASAGWGSRMRSYNSGGGGSSSGSGGNSFRGGGSGSGK